MTTIKVLAAISLALCATATQAETVYKYLRADGTIVYSDSPNESGRLIGKFELVPVPATQAGSGEKPPSLPEDRTTQRSRALDAIAAEIKAAAQALEAAKARQLAGEEPLPGERVGSGNGRSRLRGEYFARQRELAGEVEAARIRLEEAYKEREELRD